MAAQEDSPPDLTEDSARPAPLPGARLRGLVGLWPALSALLGPMLPRYLSWRARKGKEIKERLGERFGKSDHPRPEGCLIWIHAASVGEAQSVLPVIKRLQAGHPRRTVLLTTMTTTAAELMAKRLPKRAIHQFVPLDHPKSVRRFLDHWRPDLSLWVESEIWPVLLSQARARGIPTALINARLSEKSFANWRRLPRSAKALFGGFSVALAQDRQTAERLSALGCPRVKVPGNLKMAALPLPAAPGDLARLQEMTEHRPHWLAASTQDPEEAMCARVHAALKTKWPELVTMIAPRHPERADAVEALLAAQGLRTARHSRKDEITPDTDIYLIDTIGDLGLAYRLNKIVFVGRTLSPFGGSNPLEPARLGCALIHGPSVFNFEETFALFAAKTAALRVSDEAGLLHCLERLLKDDKERHRLQTAAGKVTAKADEILERTLHAVEALLPGVPDLEPQNEREASL